MPRSTPEQRASAELARAAFSDPETRAKLEAMASEMADRDAVPDDFDWLPADEFTRIRSLAGRIITSPIEKRADGVSLHGVDPEDAIRAMLHTPPAQSG